MLINNTRIVKLVQAQDLINQAIDYITEAVENTNIEDQVHAYIIGHLDNWANGENDCTSIPNIINDLKMEE